MNKQLISISDLAKKLQVKESLIRAWIFKGEIPYYKVGPKLIRFKEEEIVEWIAIGKSQTGGC